MAFEEEGEAAREVRFMVEMHVGYLFLSFSVDM